MKLLISVSHPAHVHLFKNLMWTLEKRGHEVKVIARNKEICKTLLDIYGFEYDLISNAASGLFGLGIEMVYRTKKCASIIKRYNPDLVLSTMDPSLAIASKVCGKKYISLADTEHATFVINMALPFIDVVLTPSCFKKNLGQKQIYYNGCHELAYLHPNYFSPDPNVLNEIGVNEKDNIFLIRFAAFKAAHDIKSHNFRVEFVMPLIKKLEKKGKIIISSEVKLDKYLEKYQYNLSPRKYQDLLYYANMYIGESSTSAEEAAIMGTPSLNFERILINGTPHSFGELSGVLSELENKYGLVYCFHDEKKLLQKLDELLDRGVKDTKQEWIEKSRKLLKDKIDVTQFMVWFIENYPESFHAMKDNSEVQNQFKTVSPKPTEEMRRI